MDSINSFIHLLDKIETQDRRLGMTIKNLRCLTGGKSMELAYAMALKLAEESAKLTLLTRALPAYTGNPRALQDVDAVAAESVPIEAGFTIEGWFCIRLPLLLPKKERGSASYIRGILYPALRSFFQGKAPVRYPESIMIFRHVYEKGRPERRYRDHDNTGDDTDGTELQVAQPVILEVQLGPQWAGVEFQLKTDAGLYPGTIDVGQDGILRTELGNSGSYVLSCLTLNAAVPAPGDIPSPDVTQQEQEPLTTDSAENADAASQNVQEQDSGRPTVSGIPVMHIILFGGGLLLAVGALVAMRFIRNRRPSERSPYDPDDEDDDEDDYEY